MLRLLTLGGLAVHGPQGLLSGAAAQPRRLAVLVLIARSGIRGTPRAKVLGLLWPDASEEQGRKTIAQAIYALRRDLGDDESIVGTQVLQLGSMATCDLCEFESALANGDRAKAVDMYAGPFLDGFRLPGSPEFERWVDDERTAIHHRFHEALEALATSAETRKSFDEAVRWWRKRSSSDPLDARVAIATMKSLAAAGDPGAAIRHAGVFEALIGEALDLPADREVAALAESIRRASAVPAPTAGVVPSAARDLLPSSPSAKPTSVAVLQMSILGSRADTAAVRDWADGLAEEVIHSLLDENGPAIIGRTASFALGSAPTLASLTELGVSHAVEGCVSVSEKGLRATVRLLEVGAGRIVWWHRVDVARGDAHALHDEIAARVAAAVR